MADAEIEIEVAVVYALPAAQTVVRLRVAAQFTVEQAIRRSGILQTHAEIDLSSARVGVYGKLVRMDAPLNAGDRVEIYRALTVDPKDARRRRQGRVGKKLNKIK